MYQIDLEKTKLGRICLTRIGELKRYFNRLPGMNRIESEKYFYNIPNESVFREIQDISLLIRGTDYQPAIFIHGVMTRSGTNYLSDLMARHNDIFS